MKQIDANEMSLEKYLLITEETFVIPFSQRPYEWGEDQVKRLFNDLVGLHELHDEIHMLNFFTLSGEDNDVKIFDGQQRTITILLLLSVFIKKLDELKQEDAAGQYQELFILQKNYRTSPPSEVRKLKFVDNDVDEFFNELIKRKNTTVYDHRDYNNATKKNLIRNYNVLKEELESFIVSRKIDSTEILKLLIEILKKSTLIVIKTSTDELARAMFETLNNTGKKLENFYVLKNDLVIALSEDEVRDKWTHIESNLENYDPSHFLLCFATIKTGKSTRQNTLSRLYKNYDKSSFKEMDELLNEMMYASDNYLQIRNPSQLKDTKNKKEEKKFKELTNQIKIFEVKQHYPLLLALFKRDEPLDNINSILKLILNLVIRNFYFNEERANTIEKRIAELAKNVYIHNITIDKARKEILKMTRDDDELKVAILKKEVSTKASEKKLKFILRETFNEIDLKKEVEIKKNLESIQYEHILPRNPNKESNWLQTFKVEEERMKYVQKVGNATLLLDKLNNSIGNGDFDKKKAKYEESTIPENKAIAKRRSWNKQEIDARTKNLSEKIIKYLKTLEES